MKFMMLHAVDESTIARTKEGGVGEALTAWVDEMTARGVLLDGARLRPVADATSVRSPGGSPVVTDGPFAETKEQVAGYDVIDCPDLDSAVAVAAAHPTTELGVIEVRAFDEGMPDPDVPEGPAGGKHRYLMLVCADMSGATDPAGEEPQRPASESQDPEEGPDDIERWIEDAGPRRLYGWPLALPGEAVTVRRVDGRLVTVDGPFAETKEQIAGYDLLECSDLDDALEVASSHPVAGGGVIELRPLWS